MIKAIKEMGGQCEITLGTVSVMWRTDLCLDDNANIINDKLTRYRFDVSIWCFI